jgi:signal transduction histidine kinase
MVGTPTITPTPKRHGRQLKLRGKFISVVIVMLIAVFLLMGTLLLNNARVNLTATLNRETKAFAALSTEPIGDSYTAYYKSDPARVKQQMQKISSFDANISNIAIVNLQNLTQFSLDGGTVDASTSDLSSNKESFRVNDKNQIVLALEPYLDQDGQHKFSIAYQISSTHLEENIRKVELTVLMLVLLGLVLSALVTYEFINLLFIKPLRELSRAAAGLMQGNFSIGKLGQRSDEIGELANSINDMANNLKANIAKLKQLDIQKDEFIKIVSHNLRTPLTIIQSNAAFLDSSEQTPILKKMVQGIEDSARRLNLFSEQILTITDYESGKSQTSLLLETSLNEMLGNLSNEYAEMAKSKAVNFKPNIQNGSTRFLGSQYLVAQAVRNLLDNALKFTPEQGTVELNANVGQKIVIQVKDTGIGIKPEEMPHLFTKFHRANETLVYNYEGTGIGLYVTKLIIDEQKGSIKAESKLGEGTTFTIELPYIAPQKVHAEEQLTSQ